MISKTESGRVSKEIPGSGSGSGTRWTLITFKGARTVSSCPGPQPNFFSKENSFLHFSAFPLKFVARTAEIASPVVGFCE